MKVPSKRNKKREKTYECQKMASFNNWARGKSYIGVASVNGLEASLTVGFVQKYSTFGFLFNVISTFETINKNTHFLVNNLFIIIYKLLTIT